MQLTTIAPPEADGQPESRAHTEIQGKLRDIGMFEGFDVWVADRGIEWKGSHSEPRASPICRSWRPNGRAM